MSEQEEKKEEDVILHSLQYPDDQGGLSAMMSHSSFAVVASAFVRYFKESGGVNYMEFTMADKNDPAFGDFTVMIQRKNGKTAAEKAGRYRDVLKSVFSNWDCDPDGHKYGTSCRCCEAEKALKEMGDL